MPTACVSMKKVSLCLNVTPLCKSPRHYRSYPAVGGG